MAVLNMLNTKYIINNGQDGQPTVQQNSGALGNAWFVDEITTVETPNDEISSLTGLDTRTKAVVLDKEFNNYVDGLDPILQPGDNIALTAYEPDHLTYQSKTSSEQFAVFSEIWYGPDEGWKVYLDGEEVPYARANYALRAMRIPAGEHTIEFIFHPSSYYTGEKINLFSSLFLIGLFVFVGFKHFKQEESIIVPISYDLEVEKPKKLKKKTSPGKPVKSKRKKR